MTSRAPILLALLLATSGLVGCVQLSQQTGPEAEGDPGDDPEAAATAPGTVKIEQDQGGLVYWVLPGQRTLGEASWGTPEHPKNTLAETMDDIDELPAPYNESVGELVEQVPIVAGLPMEARVTNEANTSFTHTKMPTPVSDKGKIVDGSFEATLHDRTPWDLPTKFDDPTDTPDAVEASAAFTDPDGNEYRLEVDHLRQWTWQENGGGVITNGFIHGNTGIDSPLFPRAFTYGAFWGIGTVSVNGEVLHEDQWIHFMTTQIVRDSDYALATQEDLPLDLDDTIAGQPHHTHVIVRPIEETPEGPAFNPVNTAFELKPGKTQPFIHAMFEEDRILSGPFADEPEDPWMQSEDGTESAGEADVTVTGEEWQLSPGNVTVDAGEQVTVGFENAGEAAHNWALDLDGDGAPDHRTATIQPGETATVTFTVDEPGEYAYFCNVSGHRDAGMEGTLTAS